jgi:hypothetical protein
MSSNREAMVVLIDSDRLAVTIQEGGPGNEINISRNADQFQ